MYTHGPRVSVCQTPCEQGQHPSAAARDECAQANCPALVPGAPARPRGPRDRPMHALGVDCTLSFLPPEEKSVVLSSAALCCVCPRNSDASAGIVMVFTILHLVGVPCHCQLVLLCSLDIL